MLEVEQLAAPQAHPPRAYHFDDAKRSQLLLQSRELKVMCGMDGARVSQQEELQRLLLGGRRRLRLATQANMRFKIRHDVDWA
eukprot:366441-Chlamydomonas_euryale.AAC.5